MNILQTPAESSFALPVPRRSRLGLGALCFLALATAATLVGCTTSTEQAPTDVEQGQSSLFEVPPSSGQIAFDPGILGGGTTRAMNGRDGFVLHNSTTGELQYWPIRSGSPYPIRFVVRTKIVPFDAVADGGDASAPAPWAPVATNDFNGDGERDVLFRNASTGELSVWYMVGASRIARATIDADADGGDARALSPWRVTGTGDFDADGNRDIVLHDDDSHETHIWYQRGASRVRREVVIDDQGQSDRVGPPWRLVSVADIYLDGHPDLIWNNTTTGEVAVWIMDGNVHRRTETVGGFKEGAPSVRPPWQVAGLFNLHEETSLDLVRFNTQSGWIGIRPLGGLTADYSNDLVDSARNGVSAPPGWTLVPR
jgi:hypothetical protein